MWGKRKMIRDDFKAFGWSSYRMALSSTRMEKKDYKSKLGKSGMRHSALDL